MTDRVTFTPNGGAARVLELRSSHIELVITDQQNGTPSVGIAIDLQATQAGMTTDDRGAEGWDSPIGITLTFFGGIPEGTTLSNISIRSSTPAEHYEQFLYYWDHSSISQAEAKIDGAGENRITISMTLKGGEGDASVDCTAPVDLVRITADETASKTALEARAKSLTGLDALADWKETHSGHYMVVTL